MNEPRQTPLLKCQSCGGYGWIRITFRDERGAVTGYSFARCEVCGLRPPAGADPWDEAERVGVEAVSHE